MNTGLSLDLYELTMAQVYFKYRPHTVATFDLFIRSPRRPFYVACGIEEVLEFLEGFRFKEKEIGYLESLRLFDDDFLEYLRKFRFQGTVFSVKEPEIVFATEPILRVTANLIEAQIIESFILNRINLATTLATKAARVVFSAQGRKVFDFSLRRTQGIEASLACAKYSYMVGAEGTSNLLAGYLYKIPVVGTMAHSYVMSFPREVDSFLKFSYQFPTKSILLVDTYDVKRGIASAVKVAKFLKRKGMELVGIRLDSGDLKEIAHFARQFFDREGLIDIIIFASGDLDEYKIKELIKENVPVDAFGVGTNMGCSSDLPFTDVIYKLVEIKEKKSQFIPTMKLSEKKSTYPGRKQVFRVRDKAGKMKEDFIGLEDEKLGERLLHKVMEKGKRIISKKSLEEKREQFFQKVKSLPEPLKDVTTSFVYPVKVSPKLTKLIVSLSKKIKERIKEKIVFFDIDTQIDFLSKRGALYVPYAEEIIKNIKKLTDLARRKNILIISTQDTHRQDDPEFKEFPPHCIKGSKGYKKIKESLLKDFRVISFRKIYPRERLEAFIEKYPQIILEKNTLSIFSNPNLSLLLESIFPDKIYVYGVATDYCVKEAVEGLLKENFDVVVVEDAVKEISSKEKERLFGMWKRKGVKFSLTEKVIKELEEL